MSRLWRALHLAPGEWMPREEAIAAAHTAVLEEGGPWEDPVVAHRHLGDWHVWTEVAGFAWTAEPYS